MLKSSVFAVLLFVLPAGALSGLNTVKKEELRVRGDGWAALPQGN